ncbi:hypothetical protein FA13DRAFT_1768724 [Coprinellus micaceus]|uniref:Uncharacterized protein n=1 Tax=Coprinellus micaceus TaxID=71717 RepID=A0A4Y7RLL0_COPMI|nr:hypothetical protein FA13DRAFT_1768724 [Coprinellus micaceus]
MSTFSRSELLPRHYQHCNESSYSLSTMNRPYTDDDQSSERSSLMTPETPSYGATFPRSPCVPSSGRIIFNATLKMACIFAVSTMFLGERDRHLLAIPKSFQQLQDLNFLLKKYRDIYPYRIFVCYVTTYLFLQAFSLPGSMYLSILGGAVWGATLCYLISAALGPALLTLPRWAALTNKWSDRIQANKDNMISFLIVLRIAPLPPHWVVNVICPHVGIGIVPFWISTALGILGVTVIHTTIGGGLDEMTSAEDFRLISWRNFFGLAAVVVGVMIPVGLRYWFRREVEDVQEAEEELEQEQAEEAEGGEDRILAVGPPPVSKYSAKRPLLATEEVRAYRDSDVILESGPLIDVKSSENVSDTNNLIVLDPSPSSSRVRL